MIAVLINPGTEGRADATLQNAEAIAARLFKHFDLPLEQCDRVGALDDVENGYFGFHIRTDRPGHVVELLIPGDDPDEFCLGKPFESRRMYVDGSSWLYGYALDAIESRLDGGD